MTTRVSYVVAYEQLRKQHPTLSLRDFARKSEVPLATFARWWRAFAQQGARALQDRSKRPHHSPAYRPLPGALLDTVRRAYRELDVGARRLHASLLADGKLSCSASSIYRVLRRCGALVRRPRRPRPVWQRYAKDLPGERAQADLQYLPQEHFQLTLIDDCSRLLAAAVLPAGDDAGGVPTQAVGDQPFAAERRIEVTTDLATEADQRAPDHGHHAGAVSSIISPCFGIPPASGST